MYLGLKIVVQFLCYNMISTKFSHLEVRMDFEALEAATEKCVEENMAYVKECQAIGMKDASEFLRTSPHIKKSEGVSTNLRNCVYVYFDLLAFTP